ncbi:Pyridoxal-dependent decarboxylase sheet domain protein, partial [Trichostrongylus colubriformis]
LVISEDLPTSYSIFINDGVYGTFNFVLTEQRKVEGEPLLLSFYTILKREGFMRADIWGPTCCSFDIIESDRRISTVHEGDWILYPQCGAYSTCLSTHFNGFYPSHILYLTSESTWTKVTKTTRRNRGESMTDRILSKM